MTPAGFWEALWECLGSKERTCRKNKLLLHFSVPAHPPAARWSLFCPPLPGISGRSWQPALPGLGAPPSLHPWLPRSQSGVGSAPPGSSHNPSSWRPEAGKKYHSSIKWPKNSFKRQRWKGGKQAKREKKGEHKSCVQEGRNPENSTSSSINAFGGSTKKKSLNFNNKKNLHQILLWPKTEAEKLILNSIRAPKTFPALNPALQLGPKKHHKVKCFSRGSGLWTELREKGSLRQPQRPCGFTETFR